MKNFVVALLLLIPMQPLLAQGTPAPYPRGEQALYDEIISLDWETQSGSYKLTRSNGSINLTGDHFIVRDSGAQRLMYLLQGTEHPEVEAVVFDPESETQLIISYFSSGYVSLNDWGDLDADQLLETLKTKTHKANDERTKLGLEPLYVNRWLSEPTLDRAAGSVRWVISAQEGNATLINAVVLKLGRYGFGKTTWVGSAVQYQNQQQSMQILVDSYIFDEGARFSDYVNGDTVAAFGAAALVAATAGGNAKAIKATATGIVAVMLAIAKKFIIVPFALVFGFIGSFIKRIYNRESSH